jgi:hypothetical protein
MCGQKTNSNPWLAVRFAGINGAACFIRSLRIACITAHLAPGNSTSAASAGAPISTRVLCRIAFGEPTPATTLMRPALGGADDENLNVGKWLRQALRNGYINVRYGTNLRPATDLGAWLAPMLGKKRGIDYSLRGLPRGREAQGRNLLDIGCGSGDYLRVAAELGWQATGLDPDPQAAALNSGLNPKHESWLNQAEIEISLFSRQCLGKCRSGTSPHYADRPRPGITAPIATASLSSGSSTENRHGGR